MVGSIVSVKTPIVCSPMSPGPGSWTTLRNAGLVHRYQQITDTPEPEAFRTMLPTAVTCTCPWWLYYTGIVSSSLKWRPSETRIQGNHMSGQWFSQQVNGSTSVVWASGLNPGDTTWLVFLESMPQFPVCKIEMIKRYPQWRPCVSKSEIYEELESWVIPAAG